MAETVIDTFVTRFLFRTDRAQLRALERRIGQVRQKLDGMSRGFSIAGGVITGALVGAARPLDDFSKSINRLERDLQPTNEQLALLKAQAIEIGNNARYTTINVEDVINAQRELGKAGLTVNEVMSLTPKIMDLVAATELDVADAAGRGVKLMSAFGLSVEDMGAIFDRMAWTAVNANTTFDQLLNGVSRIGPTARVAGYDVEEMIAAFAMLNAINIQPERAETGLRQFMIKLGDLEKLPEDAIDALKELDISIGELKFIKGQGDFLGLLELFKERGAGIMEISRAFGSEAAPIILGLMENIGTAGKLMADATEESAGQVVSQAVIMNKGFSGALAAMRSSMDTAVIALGDAGLNDILIGYVTRIRSVIEAFMALDDETKRWITTGLAMGPVLLGLGGLFKGLSILLGGFLPLIKGVGLVLKPIIGLLTIVLGAKLWAAAALIGGALLGIWYNWDDISKKLEGTWLGDLLAGKNEGMAGEIFAGLKQELAGLGPALDGAAADVDAWFKSLTDRWTGEFMDFTMNVQIGEDPWDELAEGYARMSFEGNKAFGEMVTKWADIIVQAPMWGILAEFFKRGFADIFDYLKTLVMETDWFGLLFPSIRRYEERLRGGPEGPQLPPDYEHPGTLHDWLMGLSGATRPGDPESLSPYHRRRLQEEGALPAAPSAEPYGPALPPGLAEQLMSSLQNPMPAAPPVLPAGPAPVSATAAAGGGDRHLHVTVDRGAVVIQTPDGDPETIKAALDDSLGNMFNNLVEDFDGNVRE